MKKIILSLFIMFSGVFLVAEVSQAVGWVSEIVDSEGGTRSSLILDSSNNPHISYYGSGYLRYAYKLDNTWHTEEVGNASSSDTSIAFYSLSNVGISYYLNFGKFLEFVG